MSWTPPKSPYNLIQEHLWEDPWKIFVACIFCNLTRRVDAEPYMWKFFKKYPTANDAACANHADLAATMLEPFVSEKNYWIVKHHGIFQGYYFFEYVGLDKNLRDQFKGHEHWNDCLEFCAKYDQNSFDPKYENMTIEEFEPMVRNVFSKPKQSIYLRRDY